MTNRFLIINVDDVCFAKNDAEPLAAAAGRGMLSSVSIAANFFAPGPAVEKLIAAKPDIDIGIHINLSEGGPVLPPERVSTLVNERGLFRGLAGLLSRSAAGLVSDKEIEEEVRAQYGVLEAEGIKPGHIDGHHHAHLIPAAAKACARIGAEKGVRFFRPRCAPLCNGPGCFYFSNIFYHAFNLCTAGSARLYVAAGLTPSPEAARVAAEKGEYLESLMVFLKRTRLMEVELMLHPPAAEDDTSGERPKRRVNERRAAEMEFILTADAGEIEKRSGFIITTRKALKREIDNK